MNKIIIIVARVILIVYLITVISLCFLTISTPNINMNDSFLGIEYDKYVHFLMFLPFPILFWINLVLKKKSPKWPIVITFIIGLTLSAFTEISQWLFLKSRTGDIMD